MSAEPGSRYNRNCTANGYQKGDPTASKELAVVALTKIYMLLHPYQTLVREMATPTIPAFATACIQILKSSTADSSAASLGLAETICDSLSSLVPLYSPTLRPSSTQVQNAVRPLLAPTSSDDFVIPTTLQEAARRLLVLQHYVAAKSGGSDEWNKHINDILDEVHYTADQVLRAIDEPEARPKSEVVLDGEPCGGAPKSLYPSWVGIGAGSQRLIGLLHYLSACLLYSTKGPVAIPLSRISDAISRLCLVARQLPKSQSWDQALQTKTAIGREEKEELWSVLPDIHIAALQVVRAGFERLGEDLVSLAPELLDHIVRVFNSGISTPSVRCATYDTLSAVLCVVGPTLSKPYVDALGTVMGACCRDLQEDAGHLTPPAKTAGASETKKNGAVANADLFLKKPEASSEAPVNRLEQAHRESASSLLTILFSNLPQAHLKPSLRGLLDQTAILTRNREAMVSSVLNPFTDPRGRRYASILPHLAQLYPQDQALEVLRTNLRTDVAAISGEDAASVHDMEESEAEDVDMDEAPTEEHVADTDVANLIAPSALQPPKTDLPAQVNPFGSIKTAGSETKNGFSNVQHRAQSPPKRKHESEEDSSSAPPKRQELGSTTEGGHPSLAQSQPVDKPDEDEDDDDSDESVHLNMVLEDDEDDDEDEL